MKKSKIELVTETLHQDWGQFFRDYEVIHEEKSDKQHLLLINTLSYGKVLLIDGVVQVAEKDNFVYHEMLTHVPIISHGNCKKVLIIGGGDGGMAKEVLKYKKVKVTQVEIDCKVVDFARTYLSDICGDAFDNDQLTLLIADGSTYVRDTSDRFDVIIIDSTDPIGPGKALFTKDFYSNCKRILNPQGILVTQNGIPFSQAAELQQSVAYFKELFSTGTCYVGTVPSYIGGEMAFGFATDNKVALALTQAELARRFAASNIDTNYYTPTLHKASFILPRYIEKLVT